MEAIHSWLSEHMSEKHADRWQDALMNEIAALSVFPRMHPIARENDRYELEIRRMLYYGPGNRSRRRGSIYRILFFVIDPRSDGESGIVRVIHVWNAARSD